jgi:hypothetical protein
LLQGARQRLAFIFCTLPVSNVAHDTNVLANGRTVTAGMCDHMEVSNITVRHQQPVLKIKVHPIPGCPISQV